VRNPLAGKKARVLYRNPDKSTVLQVADEHDEILVTVEEDGTMFEERWTGVAGVREAWEVAAPSPGAVLVPDDAGRKVWTHWSRMNRRLLYLSLSRPLVRRRVAAWTRNTSHRRKSGTRLLPVGCRGVVETS